MAPSVSTRVVTDMASSELMKPSRELSAALAAPWQELSTHTGSGFEISPGCLLRDANKEKKSEIEKKHKELDAVGKRRKVCGVIILSCFCCCWCCSEMPLVCYDNMPFGFLGFFVSPSCHVWLRRGFRKINTKGKTVELLAGSELRPPNSFSHAHLLGSFFCGQEIESNFFDIRPKVFSQCMPAEPRQEA